MLKLQTGISELGRFFWSNRLPQFWVMAPCLVRLVRNQFHRISSDEQHHQHIWMGVQPQAGNR
jgi:hypothetical protein